MRIVVTDRNNKDFTYLSGLVDDEYFQMFGEVVLEYSKHNKLESLDDVVLIYSEGKPVACGAFRKFENNAVEIKRVFVCKSFRRQGLARKVMRKLEEIARQKGYARAVLQTGSMMGPAIALYEAIGYKAMENYKEFAGDENCACFQKKL